MSEKHQAASRWPGTELRLARQHLRGVLGCCLALALTCHPAVHAAERTDAASGKLRSLRQAGLKHAQAGCPKSARVQERPVQNEHDPSITDVIRTTTCQGMEIGVYRANYTKPPRLFLYSLGMENWRRHLPAGLQPGMPRSAVEAIFGTADLELADGIAYAVSYDKPSPDTIAFKFTDGKLRRIDWGFGFE